MSGILYWRDENGRGSFDVRAVPASRRAGARRLADGEGADRLDGSRVRSRDAAHDAGARRVVRHLSYTWRLRQRVEPEESGRAPHARDDEGDQPAVLRRLQSRRWVVTPRPNQLLHVPSR